MKKSPLSTPSVKGSNYHNNRDRKRGYGYNQIGNYDNFQRFSNSNNSPNKFEADIIPLETSSPIFHNRGNWRQSSDRRNHRFSNTTISGGYNNQRNSFQSNPGSPYSPQKYQRHHQHQNHFRQKSEAGWYRKLPISEFIDIKNIFEDPWVELENKFTNNSKSVNISKSTETDSSVEIILEKGGLPNSSCESLSDETTINISSSYEEIKEDSSVDLQLESMNFSRDSKDINILSDNIISQNEKSVNNSTNQFQEELELEV